MNQLVDIWNERSIFTVKIKTILKNKVDLVSIKLIWAIIIDIKGINMRFNKNQA
jgi:hypothetical protein